MCWGPADARRCARRRVLRLRPHAVLPRDRRDVGLVERQLPDAPDAVLQHVAVVIHAAPELRGEEIARLADGLAGARLEQAEAARRGAAVVGDEHHRLQQPVIRNARLLFRALAAARAPR